MVKQYFLYNRSAVANISIGLTILLLKITNLNAYAIAGTSTTVLGFTHGLIVPACAARIMNKPFYLFWKTEGKSWLTLALLSGLFFFIKIPMNFSGWRQFLANIFFAALIGYIFSIFFILNRSERKEIINTLKRKS